MGLSVPAAFSTGLDGLVELRPESCASGATASTAFLAPGDCCMQRSATLERGGNKTRATRPTSPKRDTSFALRRVRGRPGRVLLGKGAGVAVALSNSEASGAVALRWSAKHARGK